MLQVTSQNTYLEHHIGEPNVYTVDPDDPDEIKRLLAVSENVKVLYSHTHTHIHL